MSLQASKVAMRGLRPCVCVCVCLYVCNSTMISFDACILRRAYMYMYKTTHLVSCICSTFKERDGGLWRAEYTSCVQPHSTVQSIHVVVFCHITIPVFIMATEPRHLFHYNRRCKNLFPRDVSRPSHLQFMISCIYYAEICLSHSPF